MHADVVRVVSSCDTCIAHKHQNHATLGEMGRPKSCARPFQVLSIDLVGPLPVSRKQNTFLLVVTCIFSKYCLLFPIRRATAEIVTKILEENIFLIHGIPETVIMDNGKQFVSATLKHMLSKYNVPHLHYTPKYTPHVNTVERYNKTIMTAVSTFITNDQRVWDTFIPKIQFTVNNSVNEVTGYTPSFLVHGRELITCGSHYINKEPEDVDNIIFQPRDEYAENLGTLSTVFNKEQLALLEAHNRNSKSYNLRKRNMEFNVGDVIWRKTFYQREKDKYFNKKLAPKYIKCKIVAKKSPLVYELSDMNGKVLGAWHIKDFKLVNYKE
ncbi:putative pol polyprotein [Operophtera brumata]|uniref:Putative pol polyprotein n=1 Tax=Operophtera brumata TaxID=104452 RepID=A0A0L7LID8_OPEBR|nr:putative pol polyprotein [Operophtera brumata]